MCLLLVTFRLSLKVHGPGSWTDDLRKGLFRGKESHKMYVNVRGPFGSSFEGFENYNFLMLIGGGSGIAASLSVMRELVLRPGNVARCWLIYATRTFESLQWVFKALCDIMYPKDPALTPPKGLIRLSIHVSSRLTPKQQGLLNLSPLKHVVRHERPNWKRFFRSFSQQSFSAKGIKNAKVCACATKAIYADIGKALAEINDPSIDIEFSSENFE